MRHTILALALSAGSLDIVVAALRPSVIVFWKCAPGNHAGI